MAKLTEVEKDELLKELSRLYSMVRGYKNDRLREKIILFKPIEVEISKVREILKERYDNPLERVAEQIRDIRHKLRLHFDWRNTYWLKHHD